MKDFVLTVTDAPSERAQEVIEKGLNGYNAEQAGYWDSRPLAVLASDPATSEVLGGFLGHTSLGLLFINLVYLPDSVRGSGVGSRMLALAEAEARERGCRRAVLYTIRRPAFTSGTAGASSAAFPATRPAPPACS